ncbi:hypothetical protein ONE63_009246 [Megalurothrips usitatus]|uniref:Alpha-1,3-glucosyltransferase n=1 Tax=Megalurothrips usitatus TaxID=439358 RepID=A0AAV7XMM7_9NEOP|nr:hypothetical protein ONE63_009246 [Megalurothrips usitatus]
MFWSVVLLISCVKLLFIPAYRSTDFEVHRNWLAITHSLPIKKWYTESTSEWTLDYPPLFAWFEYILSLIAQFFDPKMLIVSNLNYASPETVLFQRLSVIFADLMFAYGTKECCKYVLSSGLRKSSRWNFRWSSPSAMLQLLLLGNAGLFIVDHIHFQYNGFLYGIQLLSIAKILQGSYVAGSFWFAVLLNLKHIYAYVAPAYLVYLLRNYCFPQAPSNASLKDLNTHFSMRRFTELACTVSGVFLVSFGPFVVMNEIGNVLSRLFPFKRGLSHAYWAPNFWALYNTADKFATIAGHKYNLVNVTSSATMTGGLVQEFEHTVLPSISPRLTFLLTLLSIVPALVKLWLSPGNPLHFVRCLVLCACGSFMFGWHVHEKAVLMIIIPLTVLAVVWRREAQIYLILSTVGHYSLFPLLFTPFELPIKVSLLLIHAIYAFLNLSHLFALDKPAASWTLPLLNRAESLYLVGLVPLFLFEQILHPALGLDKRFPFLPLMLTSGYCACGVLYCFLQYYWHFMKMSGSNHKRGVLS